MLAEDLAAWLEDQAVSVRGDSNVCGEFDQPPTDGDMVGELDSRLQSYRDQVTNLSESCNLYRNEVTVMKAEANAMKTKIHAQSAQIDGLRRQVEAYVKRLEK